MKIAGPLVQASFSLLIAVGLPSQMSGNYTIDPSGTGSNNFKSFIAAVYELWQKGMSGPVTFTVAPGSYKENWAIVAIQGLSAKNSLTFKSQVEHKAILEPGSGNILTIAFANPNESISGLIFDGLQFANAAYGIYSRTPTADVEVKNCLFAKTLKTYGIRGSFTTRWNIHHCLFDGGASSYNPAYFAAADDVAIHHNDVRLTDSKGIYISSTSTAPERKPTRIYNNIFTGSLRYSYAAIQLGTYAYEVEISHNSVLLTGSSSSASCLRVSGFFAHPHKIFGNIFVTANSAPAVTVDTISPYSYLMDGNIYHAPKSIYLFQVYTGASYPSLSAWQTATGQDKNSIQADPQYAGGLTSPFDLHLKPTSPAIGKAVNTPSYVVDDFDGKKRPAKPTIGAYEADPPPTFTAFGTGCAGTGGVVPVIGYTGDLKTGSTNFAITLNKALGGLFVNAFFAIGASKTTWNGTPLPINLGGGCSLLVAPHILILRSVSGPAGAGNGSASVTLGIPSDPKLKGVEAHFQWAVVDSAAAGIGLAFSNAATVKI